MAWNLFPTMLALDESTGDVARNAVGEVFAPEDTARATPLALQDPSGVSMSTAVSNRLGVIQRFRVDGRKYVVWKSGSHEVDIVSIEAIIGDVDAAVLAAQQAAGAAAALLEQAVRSVNGTGPDASGNVDVAGGAGGQVGVDDLSGLTPIGRLVYLADTEQAGRNAIGAGTSSVMVRAGTNASTGAAITAATGTAASDSDVLKLSGDQVATGRKQFDGQVIVVDGNFTQAKVANLASDLGQRWRDRGTHVVGAQYAVNDVFTTPAGFMYLVRQAGVAGAAPSGGSTAAYQLIGSGAAGSGSSDVRTVLYSGGAYPVQPTEVPAGVRVRWFHGPVAYTGPTWPGVLDRYTYAALT